jgi:hypothetical protein
MKSIKAAAKSKRNASAKRFSAKLLFQFRVMVDGSARIRRLCEERIITFTARDARTALIEAKKRGRAAQHSYKNSDGNPVHFELVGILELLCLDLVCHADEVWFEITERVTPMERRDKLIPDETQLHAIRNDD